MGHKCSHVYSFVQEANEGRDKLVFIASKSLEPFGKAVILEKD